MEAWKPHKSGNHVVCEAAKHNVIYKALVFNTKY